MMTPGEFVGRAVGIPWVRWRSDWQAADCFGLVLLYNREVMGVNLGAVPKTDMATGFAALAGWGECDPKTGATCFMGWHNGAPTHCGILLPGSFVLHSEGSDERQGSVRITRIAAMQRAYGDLRFYTYTPTTC